MWIGQLVAFVVTRRNTGLKDEWAFVRWFEEAPHSELTSRLDMTRLRWCKHDRQVAGGRSIRTDYYDLVPVKDIIEPVFIQPDPTSPGLFFFNHHVR